MNQIKTNKDQRVATRASKAPATKTSEIDCTVQANCVGTECAPTNLACLNNSSYTGLKKPQGAGQYRLPSKRWVFTFPFQDKNIKTGNMYMGGDDNGIKFDPQKRDIPSFLWSYSGNVLRNKETGQVIEKISDYEVTLAPYDSANPNQSWLFDGQRFYSIGALEGPGSPYYYLSFDTDRNTLYLKQGEEGDIYMSYANPSVKVDDYKPPYEFVEA